MKLKKAGIIVVLGVFVVMLFAAIAIGMTAYSGSRKSRVNLLTSYFRALAADDRVGIDELTATGFFSDLMLPELKPGAYELFDFGETTGPDSMVQRFLLIVDSSQAGKTAHLADMEYERRTLGMSILAIRVVGHGIYVKP